MAPVSLSATGKAINDAGNPLHPGPDSLDLRYRAHVGPALLQNVNILVTGQEKDEANSMKGWDHLGKFSQMASKYNIIVDGEEQLPQNLSIYGLVYLGGKGYYSLKHRLDFLGTRLRLGRKSCTRQLFLPAHGLGRLILVLPLAPIIVLPMNGV